MPRGVNGYNTGRPLPRKLNAVIEHFARGRRFFVDGWRRRGNRGPGGAVVFVDELAGRVRDGGVSVNTM